MNRNLIRCAFVLLGWLCTSSSAQQFVDLRFAFNRQPLPTTTAFDIDRDGDVDLVLNDATLFGGVVQVLVNDGSGRFTDESARRLPATPRRRGRALALDVDRDGDTDLFFAGVVGPSELWINDGRGVFRDESATRLPALRDNASALAAVDLEGDGDDDLVVVGAALVGGRNYFLVNDGKGNFRLDATRLPITGFSPIAVHAYDLDGDGDTDLLIDEFKAQILINDGRGGFVDEAAQRLRAGPTWARMRAVCDFDGDGDLDVFCSVDRKGTAESLLINDGKGNFVETRVGLPPGSGKETRSLLVADFDADGDCDVVYSSSGPSLTYWSNDGRARFTDLSSRLPSSADYLHGNLGTTGDFDGDGDVDLTLSLYRVPDGVRILSNLERQVVINGVPRVGRSFAVDVARRLGLAPRDETVLLLASPGRLSSGLRVPGIGGEWFLNPTQFVAVGVAIVRRAAGYARIDVPVPGINGLRGQPLFLQSVFIADTAPRLALSNLDFATILR